MEPDFSFLAVLLQANDKEKLKEIIRNAYRFEGPGTEEGDNLIQLTVECLSLQNSPEAIELIRNVKNFEKTVVEKGLETPTAIEELLPSEFQSKLRKFLVACIQENLITWKLSQQSQHAFSPKLVDFDWTVNYATASSNQSNLNVPICSLQLQVLEGEKSRGIDLELNPASLDMLLDRLTLIKKQLDSFNSS